MKGPPVSDLAGLHLVCQKCGRKDKSTHSREIYTKNYTGPCGDSFCFASCDLTACRALRLSACDDCAKELSRKPPEKKVALSVFVALGTRGEEELAARLVNAYQRGFRDAVAGKVLPSGGDPSGAYVKGFQSGARRLQRATARAERLAKKTIAAAKAALQQERKTQ